MRLLLFCFILIIITLITSCVGPLIPVIRLDKQSKLQLRERMTVYEHATSKQDFYKRLGQIKATSCMNQIWDSPASREDAIDQLLYKASALGGNGIVDLICEEREGTNLAKNCWNSVTCYAVAVAVNQARTSTARAVEPTVSQGVTTGTAFIVNDNAHILTNQHVVDGCRKMIVRISNHEHEAYLLKQDSYSDLAVLKAEIVSPQVLRFQHGKTLRAGDEVIALGFPLSGLLAQEPHVATGTVTALTGINNDTRYLQTSTPLQLGNSGSPLLDRTGTVVGMVVGKLDAIKLAIVTGDIPQNVNFALHGRLVETFLHANGIDYLTAASQHMRPVADIVEETKGAIVLLECYR